MLREERIDLSLRIKLLSTNVQKCYDTHDINTVTYLNQHFDHIVRGNAIDEEDDEDEDDKEDKDDQEVDVQ